MAAAKLEKIPILRGEKAEAFIRKADSPAKPKVTPEQVRIFRAFDKAYSKAFSKRQDSK